MAWRRGRGQEPRTTYLAYAGVTMVRRYIGEGLPAHAVPRRQSRFPPNLGELFVARPSAASPQPRSSLHWCHSLCYFDRSSRRRKPTCLYQFTLSNRLSASSDGSPWTGRSELIEVPRDHIDTAPNYLSSLHGVGASRYSRSVQYCRLPTQPQPLTRLGTLYASEVRFTST